MEETKTRIQSRLETDYQAFVTVVNGFSDEAFRLQPDGKWSVGDVMQHLYLSARPVARLMADPRDVLDQWGKPTAPSRTYDELASTYAEILGRGVKAPPTMLPRPDDMQMNREDIMDRFTGVYESLIETLAHWSEQELDNYCMPHPALGKLTIREMIYFTSIHTQHHLQLLPQV